VTVADGVRTSDDLIAAVEATGYTARLARPVGATAGGALDGAADEPDDDTQVLRTRVLVSAVLTVPVILLAMVPALQFDAWQWLSLTLAAPVVVWGGAPFHRAAWANPCATVPPRWTR
jgi:P-type Cu+ transporter